MIYFDNAATSWPKPPSVLEAISYCLRETGANPGRAGHKMSLMANEMVDGTRKKLGNLFGIDENKYERIIFTLNATEALNLAIKGLLKDGDHVIISSMEHNSVSRPINLLEKKGVSVTRTQCDGEGNIDPGDIRKAIKKNTKLIAFTHASNVTGTVLPIEEIGKVAGENAITLLVDAAQSAGALDIDVKKMNIGLLAFPGHKSLLGPAGTGGLYVGEGIVLEPLIYGGTGSQSALPGMPEILPERYEAGTLNTIGIAGLGAGVEFIQKEGMEKIRKHELFLTQKFIEESIKRIKGIKIYGPKSTENRAPVVSFAIEGRKPVEIGGILDKYFGVACRAGLHCSPDAHITLGTYDQKLVRFSFSYYNTDKEVEYVLDSLEEIVRKNITLPDEKGCGC